MSGASGGRLGGPHASGARLGPPFCELKTSQPSRRHTLLRFFPISSGCQRRRLCVIPAENAPFSRAHWLPIHFPAKTGGSFRRLTVRVRAATVLLRRDRTVAAQQHGVLFFVARGVAFFSCAKSSLRANSCKSQKLNIGLDKIGDRPHQKRA